MLLCLQKAWFKVQKDDREQAMMSNGVSLLIYKGSSATCLEKKPD